MRAHHTGLALLLLLAACASPMQILTRDRMRGDADGVTVMAMAPGDALPLAVAHCARFKKAASFARRQGGDAVFRCSAS
ncbi:hypothetical protein [Caulobacter hibisci]|uniref:Lipoprotein n=1 Tax=Caulobacter hibisci TaxID=2035993 RepID=A0ABS0SWP4_9CAUL|nr:hypothetical protein [Caulobacter hibisci]MBI1684055.1 hypothetical protein [Caulobacter hibisci]